mmetsp:Transcript_4442/g.6645  ORF Transcript_4442/g.6645 Transcript_4442/m.6645 type:complete len:109 (+) Transcript_4442:256-582(+)
MIVSRDYGDSFNFKYGTTFIKMELVCNRSFKEWNEYTAEMCHHLMEDNYFFEKDFDPVESTLFRLFRTLFSLFLLFRFFRRQESMGCRSEAVAGVLLSQSGYDVSQAH